MLKSNPKPKNSNRQPIPKNYLKKYATLYIIGENGRGYKVETFNRYMLYVKNQSRPINPINRNILNKQFILKNYLKKHPLL